MVRRSKNKKRVNNSRKITTGRYTTRTQRNRRDGAFSSRNTPPAEFQFEQSSLQAFYYFKTATINDVLLEANDWVGVFNGNVCVGARQWDTSLCGAGVCDVPVMGEALTHEPWTTGYMQSGDIPSFKIYDASENAYLNAVASENIPWENTTINVLDNLEGGLITLEYDLSQEPANLISIPLDFGHPDDYSIESIFAPLGDHAGSILGEGVAAMYQNGLWMGTLQHINPMKGYWVMMDTPSSEIFSVTGTPLGNPTYWMHNYANLISFPWNDSDGTTVNIECAWPDYVAEHITAVLGQGVAAIYVDGQWYGSLTEMGPTTCGISCPELDRSNGYWAMIDGVNELCPEWMDQTPGGNPDCISFQFNLDCSTGSGQTFQHFDFNFPAMNENGNYQNPRTGEFNWGVSDVVTYLRRQLDGKVKPIRNKPTFQKGGRIKFDSSGGRITNNKFSGRTQNNSKGRRNK